MWGWTPISPVGDPWLARRTPERKMEGVEALHLRRAHQLLVVVEPRLTLAGDGAVALGGLLRAGVAIALGGLRRPDGAVTLTGLLRAGVAVTLGGLRRPNGTLTLAGLLRAGIAVALGCLLCRASRGGRGLRVGGRGGQCQRETRHERERSHGLVILFANDYAEFRIGQRKGNSNQSRTPDG
jgi:hypothetical protein